MFQHRTYWQDAKIIKTKRKKESSRDLSPKIQSSWISPEASLKHISVKAFKQFISIIDRLSIQISGNKLNMGSGFSALLKAKRGYQEESDLS